MYENTSSSQDLSKGKVRYLKTKLL